MSATGYVSAGGVGAAALGIVALLLAPEVVIPAALIGAAGGAGGYGLVENNPVTSGLSILAVLAGAAAAVYIVSKL